MNYYVAVAPGPVVIACNREPLTHGLPIGYRGYVVAAESKDDAKRIAKARFVAQEDDDKDAWTGRN